MTGILIKIDRNADVKSPHGDRGRDWNDESTRQRILGTVGYHRSKEGFYSETQGEPGSSVNLDLGLLQNCERINFSCLSHPVNVNLLWL